jgi:hypothetical protein
MFSHPPIISETVMFDEFISCRMITFGKVVPVLNEVLSQEDLSLLIKHLAVKTWGVQV